MKVDPFLWLRRVATALFVVSLPLALILTTVRTVAHDSRVYAYSIDRYNATGVTGIERPELVRAAAEIVDYFNSDDEWLDIQVVKDNRLVPLFNGREIIHMRDVKDLFDRVYRIQIATLVYSLAYVGFVVVWASERSPRDFAQEMLVVGLGLGSFIVVAGVAAVVGFESLFEQFHLLSFSNDFWLLDPTRDRLIQMFPQGFWFDVTALIGIVSLVEAGVIVALSLLYLRHAPAVADLPKKAPTEITASRA
jgi:integral membrane protein (TIGR01906 family)